MVKRYLWYVIRHKYYVSMECFKRGYYWRGLTHDLSKFLPSECIPYMRWFSDESFNELRSFVANKTSDAPHDAVTKTIVEDHIEPRRREFDRAWLEHQHRNPHHWQYWILREDDGQHFAMKMPEEYVVEMVCDWIGAGIAITGKRDVVGWYEKNKFKMALHDDTRKRVEELLKEENV